MSGILKRCLSGVLAITMLAPSLYFTFIVGQGMYYEYFLWPREKAEEHYIAPTRWQDLVFLAVFWTAIAVALFVSFRLLRFALKSRTSNATS
jgi:hypothetical protein